MNTDIFDSIIPIEHPEETEYGLRFIPAQKGIDVAEGRAKALDRTGEPELKIMARSIRDGMELLDESTDFVITESINSQ